MIWLFIDRDRAVNAGAEGSNILLQVDMAIQDLQYDNQGMDFCA